MADSELRPFTGDIRDRAVLSAGALHIVFERRGDRIGHRVIRGDIENSCALLESIEGRPQEDWPPSPPFQEGRIERSDGRMVAMLVGMAGKSHWSMSVEADADTGSFKFDVACRMKGTVGSPSSAYAISGGHASALANTGEVHVGDLLLLNSATDSLVTVAHGAVAVHPVAVPQTLPATVRWRYALRLDGQ